VRDHSQAIAATIAGAVLGGIAGYLFWSDEGRTVRRRLESSFDTMAQELGSFKRAIVQAAGAASDGLRFLDEFGGALDEGRAATSRYGGTHQTSPF
jgi:gas vesicle protein